MTTGDTTTGTKTSDRRQQHTRIPNQVLDLVIFRLKPSEQACLLYILRRTAGFAVAPGSKERKARDSIALSQFINGVRSGKYTLDVGTGLGRSAVITALQSLEQQQLVSVSYACPTTLTKAGKAVGCGWEQPDDGVQPDTDPKTGAKRCPRCRRTLSKAYGIAPLSPRKIQTFLTDTDPDGTRWGYDQSVQRFYRIPDGEADVAPSASADDRIAAEIQTVRGQLWHPDLVDQIISHTAYANKTGAVKNSRVLNGIMKPILRMQDEFTKDAVKYGLSIVVQRELAKVKGQDSRVINYAKVCARGFLKDNHGTKEQVAHAVQSHNVREVLAECYQLNMAGESGQAKAAFKAMITDELGNVADAEFDGDRDVARRHLLEAFKRGQTEYVHVQDILTSVDFIPNWNWDDDEERVRNRAAASNSAVR